MNTFILSRVPNRERGECRTLYVRCMSSLAMVHDLSLVLVQALNRKRVRDICVLTACKGLALVTTC